MWPGGAPLRLRLLLRLRLCQHLRLLRARRSPLEVSLDVEAQQPVERRRALPRVKRRAHGAGRGAAGREREMADDVPNSTCRGGLDCRFGAGHGEERTRNMLPMFVTLEVSKLSGWLNALVL